MYSNHLDILTTCVLTMNGATKAKVPSASVLALSEYDPWVAAGAALDRRTRVSAYECESISKANKSAQVPP